MRAMKGLFRRNRNKQKLQDGTSPTSSSSTRAKPVSTTFPESPSSSSDYEVQTLPDQRTTGPESIWYKSGRNTHQSQDDWRHAYDGQITGRLIRDPNGNDKILSGGRSLGGDSRSKPNVNSKASDEYPAKQPKKDGGGILSRNKIQNRRQGKTTTNPLIVSLIRSDWKTAASQLESHPELGQQEDAVFLHAQKTVALPLHVASCLHLPNDLFNKILHSHPDAVQQMDKVMGRLPLHWACMSNASVHVLEKLVQAYPHACKTPDLANDRTPLHYLTIYSCNMNQFAPMFLAPVNHKRIMKHKDKEGKTPLELARSNTNHPNREAIAEALTHHEGVVLFNRPRNSQGQDGEEISAAVASRPFQSSLGCVLPSNKDVSSSFSKALRSASSPQKSRPDEILPTPGAQAAAFANENGGEALPPLPPARPANIMESPKHSIPTYRQGNTARYVSKRIEQDKGVCDYPSRAALPPASMISSGSQLNEGQRRSATRDATRSAFDSVKSAPETIVPHEELIATSRSSKSLQAGKSTLPPLLPSLRSESEDFYAKFIQEPDFTSTDNTDLKSVDGASHSEKRMDMEQNVQKNFDSNFVENAVTAQALMDDMSSNIDQLQDSISRLQRNLKENDTDVQKFEATEADMVMREIDLKRALDNAKSVVLHQHKLLDKKREKIERLKDDIAALQALLAEEESTIGPMETSILILEDKVEAKEQILHAHRQEMDTFEVIKQSLQQEKDILTRDIENSNSELKSLQVIRDLGMVEDAF